MNGANAELFVERWRREKMLFEGLLSGDGKKKRDKYNQIWRVR